jgi:hypothetical protein
MIEVNNFKNLDELIHSGAKEIVLDSDFVFDDGKEYLDGIKIDVSDLVINGNGHVIDAYHAARIFEVCAKSIVIKNAVLINANVEGDGGAINNLEDSRLRIENVDFIANRSKYGGAIFNEGQIEIDDVRFKDNHAISGGAIVNASELTIKNASFENNHADNAGAIDNWQSLKIRDSLFSKNSAKDGGSIVNDGNMNLSRTIFEKNSAESCGAINNQRDGHLTVTNSKFRLNESKKYGIISNSGHLNIKSVKFIDNCPGADFGSLYNSDYGIRNYRKIEYLNDNPLGKDEIEYTSHYINELIQSGIKEIVVDADIDFQQTICIDKDNVFINGKGHKIEANIRSTAIFDVSGRNVILKNFSLKNLDSGHGHGIFNRGNLKIDSIEFTGFAHAIENFGELEICKSSFVKNCSYEYKSGGAAIVNQDDAKIDIISSIFKNNVVTSTKSGGGAIVNFGEINIGKSEFLKNESRGWGGAIFNDFYSKMKIYNSVFKENYAERCGGAIYHYYPNKLNVENTLFKENHEYTICTYKKEHLQLSDCRFSGFSKPDVYYLR